MEKILVTSSGRYKVLKLIQYISRFILLLATHRRIRVTAHDRSRLQTLISQCSLQRRILQLGNLYKPIKALLHHPERAPVSKDWRGIASSLSGLVEDVSEDAFTLAQLGWLPRRFAGWAIYADRAWLLGLLLELHGWRADKMDVTRRKRLDRVMDQRPKSEQVRRRQELREEEWWLDLDGVRAMCDAGQAWCDVFEVQVFDGFVVGCALTSSVLGLYRFVAKP
ncbi:protein of unknown function [Taphrina deformans PYCC 5710]|uniref:Uncharacterized protein n=1 Tax=Taphrina deformans (strain PYCC 5710 / ATCC 11124 / CBS 356.35 / IMI 108563 / JCM 9778 / NBRC 8474) TaxID=1097556 RepID=R4XBL2_TAPDE|nr:protein of unknown function [Taphrina deformans PYCC 5710]|eukprot:CCG82975.1 protein of unknown function [Taphrina deformans PYCC 5710]